MQIITILPSRKPQQVWLKFSDDSMLPLRVDDIVVLKLQKFTDLSDESYQQILHSSANYLLLEYCLRQIAISPKVEGILRQKLQVYCRRLVFKYNFQLDLLSNLIGSIIDKLSTDGLLDEEIYVQYLIRKFPKKSHAELNYRLSLLGVSAKIPLDRQSELVKLKTLIFRKYSKVNLSDLFAKNKLIAKLYRLGFPIDIIKTAIDETK